MAGADEPGLSAREESRRRWRDVWTLHVPLVLVLLLCGSATWIELTRALAGVDRAWVYTIQWPIIGGFAVAVWNHYRRHGSLSAWFTARVRAHVAQVTREHDAAVAAAPRQATAEPPGPGTPETTDPAAQAWAGYLRDLHAADPPGGPPGGPGRFAD